MSSLGGRDGEEGVNTPHTGERESKRVCWLVQVNIAGSKLCVKSFDSA